MKTVIVVFSCVIFASFTRLHAAVEYDGRVPQVAFAAQELKKTLTLTPKRQER